MLTSTWTKEAINKKSGAQTKGGTKQQALAVILDRPHKIAYDRNLEIY